MVPRKLVIAWIVSFICMMIMTGSAIQWANYVDRRSNKQWCTFFAVLDNNSSPPRNQTDIDRRKAFDDLTKGLGC